MRILLKFADSLNFKRVGKQLFSRDFQLSVAKRPEKRLVKTRLKDSKQQLCRSSSAFNNVSIFPLLFSL